MTKMKYFQPLTYIKAPSNWHFHNENLYMYLGGSVDLDPEFSWRQLLRKKLLQLKPHRLTLLDPTREVWDETWKNEKNENYIEQKKWEYQALNKAQFAVFNFKEDMYDPFSMLEIGYRLKVPETLFVCVEENFDRIDDLEFICQKSGAHFFTDFEVMCKNIFSKLNNRNYRERYW